MIPVELKPSKPGVFKPAIVEVDHLPPHCPEAETGLLGCLLLDAKDCLPLCIAKTGTSGDMFYDLRNQLIFKTVVAMVDAMEPVDVVTLTMKLKASGVLDQVGGVEYISILPEATPSPANVTYYLDIVHEKHLLRKMLHACQSGISAIYEHEGEIAISLDKIERDVMAVRSSGSAEYSSMKQLVPGAITAIEICHQRQGQLLGMSTGLVDLDKMTNGLCGSDFIVVAARPSMGKTSLGMQVAEHIAMHEKKPVGIFSLEMGRESLALRTLCSNARVNFSSVAGGYLMERDFPKLTNAAVRLSQCPIFMDDISGISIMELRSRARRMAQKEGIKLLVVDYIQLLQATGGRGGRMENRQQEISEVSAGLKQIAKELQIPVLAMSQLNRDMERNRGRKPALSDLRESGSIEQDADIVCLLYRVENDQEQPNESCIRTNLIVAKHRNGPTGEIPLIFLKQFTRFDSVSKFD